jgi:PIN domain nuclease of toxin-antitoxin system
VRLLLDTHVLIWWLRDDQKLNPKARAALSYPTNTVLISVASAWEMSIKFRIGKLDERGSKAWREAESAGFALLPITASHLAELELLPRRHGDPFDHLILAQAKAEGATVVTSDVAMLHYGIPCLRS